MARGSQAKTNIGTALLQIFPGAFIDSDRKTIRIPCIEDGTTLEDKVTLTAAKDIVGGQPSFEAAVPSAQPQNTAMTEQEINEVRELITRLGL